MQTEADEISKGKRSPWPAAMPTPAASDPSAKVRCRPIQDIDFQSIAALLHMGFPIKSERRFLMALRVLAALKQQVGPPILGFLLERDTEVVGALIVITKSIAGESGSHTRTNVSCWYVKPAFRFYAPLLLSRVAPSPDVTIINISPHSNTWKTIEAQGFARFSAGALAAVPVLAAPGHGVTVARARAGAARPNWLPQHDWDILQDHDRFGCISLTCTKDNECYPFVFRRRHQRLVPLPFAQLIYCRDLRDIGRFAGPIGRFLALRGMIWIVAAVDTPIENTFGILFRNRKPMYFKGPNPPRPGDLAYTEAALFGF